MQESPTFAQRLASLRAQRHLNQVETADQSGIGRSTISRLESGESQPTLDTIATLAKFFGCTADYLCGISDHPQALRPGDWLVDLDTYDAAVAGDQRVGGEALGVPIPDRFRICTSKEYAALRPAALAGLGHTPKKKREPNK